MIEVKIFEKYPFWSKFFRNLNFGQNVWKFWPKLGFLKRFYWNRYFSKIFTSIISIEVKIFEKYPFCSIFFRNINFGQNVWQFLPKSRFLKNLAKIKSFRKCWPKSRFSKFFIEIEIGDCSQFMAKIEIFRKILPKLRFFKKFDQNRDIRKFGPKSIDFENFHPNRYFCKYWPISIFSKVFAQIEIFRKFWSILLNFENFDQNRDFHEFWPKSKLFENFTKIEIM